MARDANRETLNGLAQANFGKDLNGAVREATALDLDLNGACIAQFGKEFNQCHDDLVTLLTT